MNNPMNLMQAVQQIKRNPMQMLLQRKMNVPQNMMNDPSKIINHLLQTGQISQDQLNAAYQMMQRFGNKMS